MANRRNVILGTAGLFASLGAQAQSRPLLRFTAATAPDSLTRTILSQRVVALHQGESSGGDRLMRIRRNTPQVIEQNLARLNGRRISQLLGGMSDAELTCLARVYTNAIHNSGRPGRLLDLLALRLEGGDLGRLSRHFGFAPVYSAIWRMAPAKSPEFQQHSNPGFVEPVPGASPIVVPSGALKPVRFMTGLHREGKILRTSGPTLDMTIYEIYLNYRTAPIGALSPVAAAFETANFASRYLSGAYLIGSAIGSGISLLLQHFAPSAHMAIGGIVYGAVESLTNVFSTGSVSDIGTMQEQVAWDFALGPISPVLATTGGDYAVVAEWNANAGGGGCGADPDGCPILL